MSGFAIRIKLALIVNAWEFSPLQKTDNFANKSYSGMGCESAFDWSAELRNPPRPRTSHCLDSESSISGLNEKDSESSVVS